MPYCSRCGVEVDQSVDYCPLCEAPIQKLPLNDGSPWPEEEAAAPPIPPMSPDERIALARIITTLGFLIPASIVLTVDWFVNRRLSWSPYVLISLGATWLWAIIPLIFHRHIYVLVSASTVVGLGLLCGMAWLTGNFGRLSTLGVPIVLAAGLLTAGIVALSRHTKRKGSNVATWILWALVLLSLGTDILVNLYNGGPIKLGWSIIVAATLMPISLLLLYLHYRPSKRTRIRRYFHV